jgi:hypothetical protein
VKEKEVADTGKASRRTRKKTKWTQGRGRLQI